MNYVYMDNTSATRMDERVLEKMKKYMFDVYAVPTSEFGYSMGIESREILEESRENIGKKINARHNEIIFTSGSTEASNLAVKGVAYKNKKKGKHIIVSKIEDFPVLHSAAYLERNGFEVSYIDVDKYGRVEPEKIEKEIKKDTILVSVQHANQEIGTMNDIRSIGDICHDRNVLFHSDATNTFTKIPIDMQKLNVDLMTFGGHTIHGPKNSGALFVRNGTPISKWMDGGYQENDMRGGLEDIPSIVGFSYAAELVTDEENERIKSMRDYLIREITSNIKDVTLNGHPTQRIPQNANITFHYVEGESVTLHLDMRGFAVSTGSACFSKSLEASHVILGIGGDHERAHGSLRFSFGRFNEKNEVERLVYELTDIIEKLREISPLKREVKL